MTNIRKKFKDSVKDLNEYIAIAAVSGKQYQTANLEMIKELTEDENIPGVYVTLSKPFKTAEQAFKKAGVDTRMLLFIDAVTKTAGGEVKKTKNCLYIGSPQQLSDISLAMDQAVRALPSKNKFVFFDSLNVLLLYNKVDTVAQFIHFLASKMRVWKVKGIIVSLTKDKNKELIDELMQFCDILVELGG